VRAALQEASVSTCHAPVAITVQLARPVTAPGSHSSLHTSDKLKRSCRASIGTHASAGCTCVAQQPRGMRGSHTAARAALWLFLFVSATTTDAAVAAAARRSSTTANSRGVVVPLSLRRGTPPQPPRRRVLGAGAATPVLGAVREGYFYAQLAIGSPPRRFTAIIDTGSTITFVPCARCQQCGTHMVRLVGCVVGCSLAVTPRTTAAVPSAPHHAPAAAGCRV
jgi:hypothetical protein